MRRKGFSFLSGRLPPPSSAQQPTTTTHVVVRPGPPPRPARMLLREVVVVPHYVCKLSPRTMTDTISGGGGSTRLPNFLSASVLLKAPCAVALTLYKAAAAAAVGWWSAPVLLVQLLWRTKTTDSVTTTCAVQHWGFWGTSAPWLHVSVVVHDFFSHRMDGNNTLLFPSGTVRQRLCASLCQCVFPIPLQCSPPPLPMASHNREPLVDISTSDQGCRLEKEPPSGLSTTTTTTRWLSRRSVRWKSLECTSRVLEQTSTKSERLWRL